MAILSKTGSHRRPGVPPVLPPKQKQRAVTAAPWISTDVRKASRGAAPGRVRDSNGRGMPDERAVLLDAQGRLLYRRRRWREP